MRKPDGSGTAKDIKTSGLIFWYEWVDLPDDKMLLDDYGYVSDWATAEYWKAVSRRGFIDTGAGSCVASREHQGVSGRVLLCCWVGIDPNRQVSLLEES